MLSEGYFQAKIAMLDAVYLIDEELIYPARHGRLILSVYLQVSVAGACCFFIPDL